MSVAFDPPTVPAGASTTLTVKVAAGTPRAATVLTVVAAAPGVTRTLTLTVQVTSAPGCTATNATDVPIIDYETARSTIRLTGCPGRPSTTSAVEVHIKHSYIGDLVVSLVAPDGTTHVLHDRTDHAAANLDETYTLDLSGTSSNGTWTLTVRDGATLDTGYLDTWTLSV